MYPAAGNLDTPAQQMAIRVVEVAEGPAGQGAAFDVVDAVLFHLPFVFGRARAARGDEEAVVLGALPIRALDLGIIERGVDDGGPEIIEHDPARHGAEELERGPMQAHPRLDRLVSRETSRERPRGLRFRGMYDRTVRRVRDLPCGGMRMFVELEVRRVACRRCGAVKRERLDFLADNPRYVSRATRFRATNPQSRGCRKVGGFGT
jgi:hypothetical protein